MAKPKRAKSKPFDRWVHFIREEAAPPVGKKLAKDDAAVAEVLALAKKNDPRVLAYFQALVDGNTSFSVFDFECYPEMLLRGRKGEAWNADGKVMTTDDVCLAKNGAGDLHVWNAKSGKVRFLVHDEGWKATSTSGNIDDFIVDAMGSIVELAGTDQLDDADDAYLARLRFAISMAGDESLDDDVRERLAELDE